MIKKRYPLKSLDLIPKYKMTRFTSAIITVIKLYANCFSKDNNPKPIPVFQTKITFIN